MIPADPIADAPVTARLGRGLHIARILTRGVAVLALLALLPGLGAAAGLLPAELAAVLRPTGPACLALLAWCLLLLLQGKLIAARVAALLAAGMLGVVALLWLTDAAPAAGRPGLLENPLISPPYLIAGLLAAATLVGGSLRYGKDLRAGALWAGGVALLMLVAAIGVDAAFGLGRIAWGGTAVETGFALVAPGMLAAAIFLAGWCEPGQWHSRRLPLAACVAVAIAAVLVWIGLSSESREADALPDLVLGTGLGGAALLGVVLQLGLTARRREHSLERQAARLRALNRAAVQASRMIGAPGIMQFLIDDLRTTLGAQQGLASLVNDGDWSKAHHSVSLSARSERWRDYQVQVDGSGIYALVCETNRPARMTQAELEAHPRWRGFGPERDRHPPMRGWLAVPLIGSDGCNIGLLQLTDKDDGEFTAEDEAIATQYAQMAAAALERDRAIAQRDRFFRISLDMFAIASGDGRLLEVNAAFTRVLGYDAQTLLAMQPIDLVHPDDRPASLAALAQLREGREVARFVNRMRCADGSYRWIEWAAMPTEGSLHYTAARDITQRRQMEEALERSLEDLRSRNRELEDFAFVASHDLQEPLRKIRAFSDRLASMPGLPPEGKSAEYLQRIAGAAARMQRLIDDLLAYSRVTTRARPFDRVPLREIVADVLLDLETRLEETLAGFRVGELPEIEADATQMRQLFLNLLGNALKFAAQDRRLEVRVRAEADVEPVTRQPVTRITVQDNGIGFDARYAERIFAPFQRLHSRSQFEGTGMGLAIVRRIVERHGGRIEAQAAPGAGSIFIVTLPLRQPRRESRSVQEEQ